MTPVHGTSTYDESSSPSISSFPPDDMVVDEPFMEQQAEPVEPEVFSPQIPVSEAKPKKVVGRKKKAEKKSTKQKAEKKPIKQKPIQKTGKNKGNPGCDSEHFAHVLSSSFGKFRPQRFGQSICAHERQEGR